jgi:hypothetical protein
MSQLPVRAALTGFTARADAALADSNEALEARGQSWQRNWSSAEVAGCCREGRPTV